MKREAFLIVAISLAYLFRTEQVCSVPTMHWGIAIAFGASVIVGILFWTAENKPLWEGVLSWVTAPIGRLAGAPCVSCRSNHASI